MGSVQGTLWLKGEPGIMGGTPRCGVEGDGDCHWDSAVRLAPKPHAWLGVVLGKRRRERERES
eukprot:2922288-Amphidinium_carterae.3